MNQRRRQEKFPEEPWVNFLFCGEETLGFLVGGGKTWRGGVIAAEAEIQRNERGSMQGRGVLRGLIEANV